jgi:hypothetical protein
MHLLCPHCHNAIELVELPTREEIVCPSCGSSFRLESGSTTAWTPRDGQRVQGRAQHREEVVHPVVRLGHAKAEELSQHRLERIGLQVDQDEQQLVRSHPADHFESLCERVQSSASSSNYLGTGSLPAEQGVAEGRSGREGG